MVRNTRRIRFSIIALAFVVALAASVAAFRTKNPGWLAGLASMVTVVLWVLDKRRGATSANRELLDKVYEELRAAVLRQWSDEVGRRVNHPYPLPVPFTVLEKVQIPISHQQGSKVDEVRIMDGWGAIRGKPDSGPVDLCGTFGSIVEVFTKEELPRRLVVLGAPGSGKSIIAQWLTVKLIESGRDNRQVPVFLPAASWNPAVSLDIWAAAEMARMYRWLAETIEVVGGKARSLAQELIAEGRVLLVLDGLDEIPENNQAKALDRLTEAAKEQRHFVVTCRTDEYARIVTRSGGPLKRTAVVALDALPASDVACYLRDAMIGEEPDRWDEFLTRLETEPDSALAGALSTSLAVWLVVMYFSKPENRPRDLLDIANEEEITERLLDGLVDALYTVKTADHPAQPERELREVELNRLVRFARFLSSRKDHLRIEWWHLPEMAPRPFLGGILGTAVGCLLGAIAGLVGAVKSGPRTGLILGISFAIVTGVLIGVTSVREQEDPRTVDISFRWSFRRLARCLAVGVVVGMVVGFSADLGGGPAVGLLSAALTGPVFAAAIIPAFGLAPGVTGGITGALGIGLADGLAVRSADPAVNGLIAGTVSVAVTWIFIGLYRPSKSAIAASPEDLLGDDRRGSIIVGVTAGAVLGTIYGLALGPALGAVAAVSITVSVALTVSMWGVFSVARVWLAMFCNMPLGIMGFFREAYDRGVLRRIGGAYQFRHELLQERLAQGASPRGASVAPQPCSPPQSGSPVGDP